MKKVASSLTSFIAIIMLGLKLVAVGLAPLALTTLITPPSVHASDDDDEGSGAPFLLLLAGPIFYVLMKFKYRNNDKRHVYERDTEATISDLKSTDVLVEAKKMTQDSVLPNHNENDLEGSVIAESLNPFEKLVQSAVSKTQK